jgi:hypothetical protein
VNFLQLLRFLGSFLCADHIRRRLKVFHKELSSPSELARRKPQASLVPRTELTDGKLQTENTKEDQGSTAFREKSEGNVIQRI